MNDHSGAQKLEVPVEGWVNIYAHGHCADFQTRDEADRASEPAAVHGDPRVAVAHYRLVGVEVSS